MSVDAAAPTRFVIVGNGAAGMEAALVLRRQRPDASVTIVSEESDHHFSRTALMWIHAGQLSHRDTEPFERDAYATFRFRRIRARAIGIDAANKTLVLAGQHEPVAYDSLLIACGSRPRRASWPGSDLRGVGYFVTHQDLAWYEEELFGATNRVAPPNSHAHLDATSPDSPYLFRSAASTSRGRASVEPAIVGGGLIGMEAVEIALARKLRPRFFLRDEWFWPMNLEQRESSFLVERLRGHGVEVHTNAHVDEFHGDEAGNVTAISCEGTVYAVDSVLVAIGVVPNTGWLETTGLHLDRGAIGVDESLRTNLPDVFAAGDCAAVAQSDGTRRTELLWYTARDQGRAAARSMLGEPSRYARGIPYNAAKLIDIEYTTVGTLDPRDPAEHTWFHEERGAVRSTTRIALRGERVVGMSLLGRRWDHTPLMEFIEAERSLRYVLDHLHEAAFDTEFVPPLRLERTA